MDIPRHAHILVIDGRKSLLFRNEASPSHPKLHLLSHAEHESPATRDQGTDRPGQTQSRVGGVRSDYEQTDFHRQDEDRFAADAARMLEREVLAGRIEALIVVAAPRTLGELRKHYHHEVEKRLLAEIPKDVAGRSNKEIAAIIAHN
jgi:protein required for attachment to host cells